MNCLNCQYFKKSGDNYYLINKKVWNTNRTTSDVLTEAEFMNSYYQEFIKEDSKLDFGKQIINIITITKTQYDELKAWSRTNIPCKATLALLN